MIAAKNQSRAPQIATVLRQRVVSGEWKPHQQIQTEHQLAREFGVSRGTVIRSLRELEREGLIWSRRGEGRYVADPTTRPKTNTIGAVILDMSLLSHPVRSNELAGIRDACAESDYHLQIFAFNTSTTSNVPAVAQADAWLQQIDPMRLDGLIVAHWGVPDERVIELSRRIPIVWESRAKISQRIGGTLHDHTGAAMDTVEHLLDLGHRDIALVTIEEMRNQGWQQRDGARLGMRKLTQTGEARLHVVTAKMNRSEDWLPGFRDILRRREDRPTAVIFGSDDLATNGLRVISDLKLNVPRDLSVISTNDTLAPPAVPVPLTAVRFDYKQLGMVSTRLLLRMIAEPQSEHATVILPGELIVRDSTARVPKEAAQRTD